MIVQKDAIWGEFGPVEDTDDDIARLMKERDTARAEAAQLASRTVEQQQLLDQMVSALDSAERRIQANVASDQRLDDGCLHLSPQDAAAIEEAVTKWKHRCEDAESRAGELMSEVHVLQEELSIVTARANAREDDVQRLQTALAATQQSEELVRHEQNAGMEQAEAAASERAEAEFRLKQVTSELEMEKERSKRLEDQLASATLDANTKLASVSARVSAKERELESMTTTLEQSMDEIQKRVKSDAELLEALMRRVADAETLAQRAVEAENRIELGRAEVDAVRQLFKGKEATIKKLGDEIDALRGALGSAGSSYLHSNLGIQQENPLANRLAEMQQSLEREKEGRAKAESIAIAAREELANVMSSMETDRALHRKEIQEAKRCAAKDAISSISLINKQPRVPAPVPPALPVILPQKEGRSGELALMKNHCASLEAELSQLTAKLATSESSLARIQGVCAQKDAEKKNFQSIAETRMSEYEQAQSELEMYKQRLKASEAALEDLCSRPPPILELEPEPIRQQPVPHEFWTKEPSVVVEEFPSMISEESLVEEPWRGIVAEADSRLKAAEMARAAAEANLASYRTSSERLVEELRGQRDRAVSNVTSLIESEAKVSEELGVVRVRLEAAESRLNSTQMNMDSIRNAEDDVDDAIEKVKIAEQARGEADQRAREAMIRADGMNDELQRRRVEATEQKTTIDNIRMELQAAKRAHELTSDELRKANDRLSSMQVNIAESTAHAKGIEDQLEKSRAQAQIEQARDTHRIFDLEKERTRLEGGLAHERERAEEWRVAASTAGPWTQPSVINMGTPVHGGTTIGMGDSLQLVEEKHKQLESALERMHDRWQDEQESPRRRRSISPPHATTLPAPTIPTEERRVKFDTPVTATTAPQHSPKNKTEETTGLLEAQLASAQAEIARLRGRLDETERDMATITGRANALDTVRHDLEDRRSIEAADVGQALANARAELTILKEALKEAKKDAAKKEKQTEAIILKLRQSSEGGEEEAHLKHITEIVEEIQKERDRLEGMEKEQVEQIDVGCQSEYVDSMLDELEASNRHLAMKLQSVEDSAADEAAKSSKRVMQLEEDLRLCQRRHAEDLARLHKERDVAEKAVVIANADANTERAQQSYSAIKQENLEGSTAELKAALAETEAQLKVANHAREMAEAARKVLEEAVGEERSRSQALEVANEGLLTHLQGGKKKAGATLDAARRLAGTVEKEASEESARLAGLISSLASAYELEVTAITTALVVERDSKIRLEDEKATLLARCQRLAESEQELKQELAGARAALELGPSRELKDELGRVRQELVGANGLIERLRAKIESASQRRSECEARIRTLEEEIIALRHRGQEKQERIQQMEEPEMVRRIGNWSIGRRENVDIVEPVVEKKSRHYALQVPRPPGLHSAAGKGGRLREWPLVGGS